MTDADATIHHGPELLDPAELDDRTFLAKAKRLASRVPFVRDAVAMWYALRDDATPVWAKFMVAGALAYFVLPIDIVPDLLAGLGYTDDAAVVWGTLQTVNRFVTPTHYARADALFGRTPTRVAPA